LSNATATQILQQIPEVDAVVGTGEVERIIEAVEGDLKVLPAQPPAFLYHDLTPRIITTPNTPGLHQNRRRLRSPLHFLHHPAASRRLPQPQV